MNPSHVPSTALSEPDVALLDEEKPPPLDGEAKGTTGAPAPPSVAPAQSPWGAGRIAMLGAGALVVLFSLCLLGAGGTAMWADRTQREAGYATTDVHEFSTSGSALATVSTELGSGGTGWLYGPGLLGDVRVRVTPVSSGAPLFVGIGPSTDVDRYLAGVDHTVITEFWGDEVEAVGGGAVKSPPATQDFWVASDTGPGPRTLEWDPEDGSWTVVVMNADGRPGIAVGADLGARVPALPWIGLGLLIGGGLLLAGGALAIAGAIRVRGNPAATT